MTLASRKIWPLLLCLGLCACSQQTAQAPPDAAALLLKIPAADPVKLDTSKEAKSWHNPYLIVRADKVGLLSSAAPNEQQMLKPEEILDALAQVPASAWPNGRIVAVLVDERTAASEQDKVDLRRNRGIVAGELKSAQVEIHWMPAS